MKKMTKRLAMLLAAFMLMITALAGAEAGLSAYIYIGGDLIEGAIANALASNGHAEQFLTEPGCVTIPCPIIHTIFSTVLSFKKHLALLYTYTLTAWQSLL